MMKTLVWGFCGSSGRAIVDTLREEFDIAEWVSDQAGSTDIWRFIRADIPQVQPSSAAAGRFADVYRQSFPVYQVMAARRGDYYADLHRVTNEFALNYYYFHEWLTSRQIELVIFAALPHEGSDYVLYQVARLLDIKTLMCYQSIFASRFFLTTALADFGHFRTVPADPAAVPVQIERSHHQALFYMQDVEKRQAEEAGKPAVGAMTETLRTMAGRGRAFGHLMAGAGLFNASQLARKWLERKREAAYEAALAGAGTDRQSLRRLLPALPK